MSPGEVAAILFGTFAVLVLLRVPVAFALGLACLPIFVIDDRLNPILMMGEMTKAYNAFILLAVPFFIWAGNLMNSAGITNRIYNSSRLFAVANLVYFRHLLLQFLQEFSVWFWRYGG